MVINKLHFDCIILNHGFLVEKKKFLINIFLLQLTILTELILIFIMILKKFQNLPQIYLHIS